MYDMEDVQNAVRSLAISDTGFVFDRRSGHSYSTNHAGLLVLRALKEGRSFTEIGGLLRTELAAPTASVAEDVADFVAMLTSVGIVAQRLGDAP